MNLPTKSFSSKIANSTAATTTPSTVFSGNPRANAMTDLGKSIADRKVVDDTITRTNRTYNSLQKQGRSFGSGFGGN